MQICKKSALEYLAVEHSGGDAAGADVVRVVAAAVTVGPGCSGKIKKKVVYSWNNHYQDIMYWSSGVVNPYITTKCT